MQSSSKASLTSEQEAVIYADDHHVAVQAYAGTGKTFTLTQLAKYHKNKKIIYIAYNRSIAKEAQRKFPGNVRCATSHSLAYQFYGKPLAHKLEHELNGRTISRALDGKVDDAKAQIILRILHAFMYSSDKSLAGSHVLDSFISEYSYIDQMAFRHYAQIIWKKMTDPSDNFPASHDLYLKMFQMDAPILGADIILLDEAQDTNPCVMDMLLSQPARKILVGDEHQSIYRFRGGENALDALPGAKKMYLTQSFRFGPECAHLANKILALKGKDIPLIYGAPSKRTEIISPYSSKLSDGYLTDRIHRPAILHRTVNQCVITALGQLSKKRAVHWIGGIDSYNFDDILDVYYLSKKEKGKIRNPQFKQLYRSFADYERAASDTEDVGMLRNMDFITRYKDKTEGVFKYIRATHSPANKADVYISTAHKSKGLEWDSVILAQDFCNPRTSKKCLHHPATRNDEININYVAATRGMKYLVNARPIEDSLTESYES